MKLKGSVIFTLLLMPFALVAQFGSFGVTDARSLGMGNTYNATSFDLYAIGKNPGLLSLTDEACKLTIIFPNLTAQQYGINRTLGTFDYYTTNKLRSDGILTINEEKFSLALDNDGKLFMDALLGFFSAAYHHSDRIGSFAFSMTDYITGYMDIPGVILDVNYGSEVPDGSFSLDDFTFKAWWIRTYGLSYGRVLYRDKSLYRDDPGLFKRITGGITAKYVLAYAYTDIGLSASASYSSADQTLRGSYQARAIHAFSDDLSTVNAFEQDNKQPRGFLSLKPAGRGFGVDIGGAAEFRRGWIVGLSVTDVGLISWTGNAARSDFSGYIDISGVIEEGTLDSLASEIKLENESRERFTTPMPTAVRVGVALKFEEMFDRFPGELLAGIDYNQGLNNEPSNFTAARFSIGLHYRYKKTWPILLGGYTYDLLSISRVALGLGYTTWFMDVYVSTFDIIPLVSGEDHLSASLVARWKILCGHRRNRAPECF